jgi:radical SAM protein with 4Fe4S-binding SPASM domain
MAEIAAWLVREIPASVVDFEVVRDSEAVRSRAIGAPEPFDFARGFARAASILEAAGCQAIHASASTDAARYTSCPLGRDALLIGPDGSIEGCYLPRARWQARSLDLVLGRASAEHGVCVDQGAVERLRSLVLEKPRCTRCFCRWTCAGGCHVEVTYPGCSDAYTSHCVQTRLITVWRLLGTLGCIEQRDALFADTQAMEQLAFRRSDRLDDWQGSSTWQTCH